MKSIPAVYENGVFKPTQPVDLPDRCQVDIEVHVRPEGGFTGDKENGDAEQPHPIGPHAKEFDPSASPVEDRIAEIMGDVPPEVWDRVPTDGSAQVDHYLYGTPKR